MTSRVAAERSNSPVDGLEGLVVLFFTAVDSGEQQRETRVTPHRSVNGGEPREGPTMSWVKGQGVMSPRGPRDAEHWRPPVAPAAVAPRCLASRGPRPLQKCQSLGPLLLSGPLQHSAAARVQTFSTEGNRRTHRPAQRLENQTRFFEASFDGEKQL